MALDPKHVRAHFGRGFAFGEEGDRDGDPAGSLTAYDKALAAFDAALALDPDYALALTFHELTLAKKGALRDLKKERKLEPDDAFFEKSLREVQSEEKKFK